MNDPWGDKTCYGWRCCWNNYNKVKGEVKGEGEMRVRIRIGVRIGVRVRVRVRVMATTRPTCGSRPG